MSVIRKKPYIESVVESLSDDDLTLLQAIVNSSTQANVNVSLYDKEILLQKGTGKLITDTITPVVLGLEKGKPARTGILIWNDSYCALFTYHRFQDMEIYKIDSVNLAYEKINEDLDINELRRVTKDALGGSGGGGTIDATTLSTLVQGSDFITADLNEAQTKVVFDLDTDYQPHIVELSGTSGTLTDEQYLQLCGATSSYTALILIDGKFYNATGEYEDYDTYTCVDTINSVSVIRTITIDKNDETKGEWTLTTEQLSLPSTTGNLNKILHVGTSGPSWVENISRKVDYWSTTGTTATGYLKFVKCTADEYSAITPEGETFYIIVG